MNLLSKLITVGLLVLLSACATDPNTARHVLDTNAKIAAQPTLTIKCETGCSASYTDPRDRQAGIKLPTNGWDAVVSVGNSVTSVIQSAVVPVVLGNIAVQGFKSLQNSGAVTTNTTVGANSGTGSGVSNSSNSTTTSQVGANSGAGSGNTSNPVTTTSTANPVTTTSTTTANPVTTTSTTTANPVTTTTTTPTNSGNTNTGATGSGNTN